MKRKLPGSEKLLALLERYKYPILILLAGVVLLLWPGRKTAASEAAEPTPAAAETVSDEGRSYCRELELQLEGLLTQIDGAGRVRVLLTLKTGPAAAYQTDRSRSEEREGDGQSLNEEEKTVILRRGSAYDEPAVVSKAYPVFRGALIIAEGAGDPSVRLRLSAAVAALLELGADQITVVKMK